MFTGIIEEVGRVQRMESDKIHIQAKTVLEGTKIGDSIAVNGVCLTVINLAAASFTAVFICLGNRKADSIYCNGTLLHNTAHNRFRCRNPVTDGISIFCYFLNHSRPIDMARNNVSPKPSV